MQIIKYAKALRKYVTDKNYRFLINASKGKYDSMPDKEYLEKKFYATMGYPLDLNNPKTFNEKLQWLKLNDRKPEYTVMVDKYLVKQYVAEKIGEEYIIPTLGVWDNADDIDFEQLPNRFVLKCNHNSGLGMYICKDKDALSLEDIKKIRKNLQKGLKQDYYLTGREWPYKDVPRKIIAEKYLEDDTSEGLNDYKVMCFNGKAKCVLVCTDRFNAEGVKLTFYDPDWNVLPIKRLQHPVSDKPIQQPKNLEKMLRFAEQLSNSNSFLRSDFYEVNGDLYFGELTFYSGSGLESFANRSTDNEMGLWINLPKTSGGGYLIDCEDFCLWVHCKNECHTVSNDLVDYKFFCFNGKVDCVMLCLERNTGHTKFYFFDRDWNLLRYNIRGKNAPEGFTIDKPSNIEEMFNLAARLSEGMPFVRIDLYNVNNRIFFGEYTFFPDSGFDANILKETDNYFGNLITLGERNENSWISYK